MYTYRIDIHCFLFDSEYNFFIFSDNVCIFCLSCTPVTIFSSQWNFYLTGPSGNFKRILYWTGPNKTNTGPIFLRINNKLSWMFLIFILWFPFNYKVSKTIQNVLKLFEINVFQKGNFAYFKCACIFTCS